MVGGANEWRAFAWGAGLMALAERLGRVLRARLGSDEAVRGLLQELALAVADEVAANLVERRRAAIQRSAFRPDTPVDPALQERARRALERGGATGGG